MLIGSNLMDLVFMTYFNQRMYCEFSRAPSESIHPSVTLFFRYKNPLIMLKCSIRGVESQLDKSPSAATVTVKATASGLEVANKSLSRSRQAC